ncbi:3'-5' exonuclease [Deinococcus yavapaiensis]|uniref:3'-5' exonuclease n=1 Tax=Deinococcus yavapaiensis TaxID=309889 RepID=UPI001FEC9D68|nr:3'-5' exonuclease [Deinococcus yavapaiensis]
MRSWLQGHDDTSGIVSVHADSRGRAIVWRRVQGRLVAERATFRPFVFARDVHDLAHVGHRLRRDDDTAEFSHHSLKGAEGSLRVLISARDGFTLRQELLRGASLRLGRSLSSLPDAEYHTLGPIEQYLTCTGRTYFKELAFDDLVRLRFDLETTSLDPTDGRIFLIAVSDSRGLEAVLEAPRDEDEAEMLRALVRLVRARDPDVIENHNIQGFDLPFLIERARRLNVDLDLGRLGGPRGVRRVGDGQRTPHFTVTGREVVDTLDGARRTLSLSSFGLKNVARALGFAEEGRVYLDGAEIYPTYQREPDLVRTYALQDVREVGLVSERVFAPAFALAKLAPRPFARVTYAGTATGILEPMLVRAYLHERHALPGNTCTTGDAHRGGAVHLFAEGVLPRVVKADIASLYPSLIRTYRISPKCDPLEVFYHLVDALTRERLRHKTLASQLPRGTREQAESFAMQAAMKTVINSAYGYLGAGEMSRFGDREAADAITRHGRAVLRTVLEGLRAHGVTLIEADTDGVYFGVPTDWDEARERQVVEDVGRSLPAEVTLAFEGRYAAMFSHEVKNYALLGYDASLTVRGASFHSSRAEPYGEAFLRAALTALLRGDVPSVRAAFDDTLRKLRARTFTNADVSVTVRVSKTPQAYLQFRSTRKEPTYEALLSAGVTDWQPGARIRYFRHANGTDVLLTDQNVTGRAYDARHYERVLRDGYATRLRKAFSPRDFQSLFRDDTQASLFDPPIDDVRTTWRTVTTERSA